MSGTMRMHEPLCPGLPSGDGVYCDCPHTSCAEKTALRLGRDAMSMRLRPFLAKLVGPENADKILIRESMEGGFPKGRAG